MAVCNDSAIGAHFYLCGLLVHIDGNSVALNVCLDGHVRKQLDGKHPGLKHAVLLTQNHATLACNRKRLLSFGVCANHGARGFESDGRKGAESRRLCQCGCGNQGHGNPAKCAKAHRLRSSLRFPKQPVYVVAVNSCKNRDPFSSHRNSGPDRENRQIPDIEGKAMVIPFFVECCLKNGFRLRRGAPQSGVASVK